jgi:hypothetical protein
MAKKAFQKKKAFQAFCRAQVKAGLINQANGNWAPANSSKAMDRDMRAGYRV